MNHLFAAALFLTIAAPAHALHGTDGQPTSKGTEGGPRATITQVYSHALPGVPGKSLKGVVVEYAPGGSSPSHRHAKSALIYATVLEGTVHCQLNGGPLKTYRAGENWTERPGDHHQVSANASKTHPAKVLAVFVVDDVDTQLTIPDAR